jgi:predicted HTH domain antitoxin
MELTLELPDIKPLSDVNDKYLKEMLVANLYHIGRLSEKEAREILGKTRREFEELLPKFGFSILGDTQDNIAFELEA